MLTQDVECMQPREGPKGLKIEKYTNSRMLINWSRRNNSASTAAATTPRRATLLRDRGEARATEAPHTSPPDHSPGHRESAFEKRRRRGEARRGETMRGEAEARQCEARRGEARWRRRESPPTHNDILIKPRRWPSRGEIQSRDNKWSRPNTFLTADEPTPQQLKEFTPFPVRPSKKWRAPRILCFSPSVSLSLSDPVSLSLSTLFIVCLIDTTPDSPLSLVSAGYMKSLTRD